jgi:triosephosphate isomerase
MKKKLIVGNWKMNPNTLLEAKRIYRSVRKVSSVLSGTDVVICPPFVYLGVFLNKKNDSPIGIGAQDAYFEEQGAFTGEVSANMLKNLGVEYVIVGHSEKRKSGDTDEIISKKVEALLKMGIHPILCVGEKERDDHGVYLETLKNQIKNSLNKVSKKNISKLIVAYEPLWAIGAKEAMSPSVVHEMALFVKKVLSDMYGHDEAVSTPVLYGGSVNFRNAGDIIVQGEVDGLLVGRESINSTGFVELLKAVDLL